MACIDSGNYPASGGDNPTERQRMPYPRPGGRGVRFTPVRSQGRNEPQVDDQAIDGLTREVRETRRGLRKQ